MIINLLVNVSASIKMQDQSAASPEHRLLM